MSSSYVEVREAENGTEENALPIAIDTCENNGIVSMSHIDGEPQKDHTYNKEPLEVQGEVEVLVSSEEVEDMEVSMSSPEKGKRAKKQRAPSPPKKTNKVAKTAAVKKETPKKAPSPKKKVTAKENEEKSKSTKIEKESVSDTEDKVDGSLSDKDSSPTKRRAQKRKAETPEKETKPKKEKLDVKKSKTVKPKAAKKDDVENDAEEQKTESDVEKTDEDKTDAKETEGKSVKKNLKTPKKTVVDCSPNEDDAKLPEGWSRKIVQRKSGKTAGQFDVYIYSPDGKKLRSRPDVAAYLAKTKSPLTVDDFSFSLKPAGSHHSTPSVKKPTKSTPTPAKTKSSPKSSPKSTGSSGKKKTASNNSKKGMRLVVKLNFSPKKRILSNYKEQEKTADLGNVEKSDGGKKTTPKKSSPKKQVKKKTPAKQTSSKK